jgi:hypothetical protein
MAPAMPLSSREPVDLQQFLPLSTECTLENNQGLPDRLAMDDNISGRKASNPYSKTVLGTESTSAKNTSSAPMIVDLSNDDDHTMVTNNLSTMNRPSFVARDNVRTTSLAFNGPNNFTDNNHTSEDLFGNRSTNYNREATESTDQSTISSFKELRQFLLNLLIDPSLYAAYGGKIFVAPSKLAPPPHPPLSFRIEKNKKRISKMDKVSCNPYTGYFNN